MEFFSPQPSKSKVKYRHVEFSETVLNECGEALQNDTSTKCLMLSGIKLHAITSRLSGQEIGFSKFVCVVVGGCLSHGPFFSLPPAVDVCSSWEKQSAMLEASTGPIKKS